MDEDGLTALEADVRRARRLVRDGVVAVPREVFEGLQSCLFLWLLTGDGGALVEAEKVAIRIIRDAEVQKEEDRGRE